MLASCWNWPSLKYEYYILNAPLDAGGWSPTKGIARNDHKTSHSEVVTLDDCLRSLPSDAYFAGVGDYCVGELYAKRDANARPSVDLDRMRSEGTPDLVKAVELLTDTKVTSRARSNPSGQPSDAIKTYYPSERTVWERLVPAVGSIAGGYFAYKAFQGLTSENIALRDLAFAWGAGLALGLTIGQEATRQGILRDVENQSEIKETPRV